MPIPPVISLDSTKGVSTQPLSSPASRTAEFDLMSHSLLNASRRSANITICIIIALLSAASRSLIHRRHGFIVPSSRQLCQKLKMTAEPTPTAELGSPSLEHNKEAVIESSKFRQTIESFKENTSSVSSEESKEQRREETGSWRVMLYNDDIHSFTYVTEALAKVIPQLSREVAHTITVEAHNTGKATVLRTWRDKAEAYCTELQKHGLTVCTIHNSCEK